MRTFCLLLLVAAGLSADQIYTWVTPPTTPYVDPEDVTIYNGQIDIDSPYTEPTIAYGTEIFDVDVATYGIPADGFETFFVLTLNPPSGDPPSIPEPALWPVAMLSLPAFLRKRKRR